MRQQKTWWKIILKLILWFIGIWAIILILVQVTLSDKVLTKIINRYSAEYIDGEVSFGSASLSVFKRFPRVFLALEDFHITYPAERFDEAEKFGAQGRLMHKGCGETADTLASFDSFSASLDIAHLINGTLRIPHLRLVEPRIFLHSYANGETNLDILKLSTSETEEDTTSTDLPKISLGRISLSRHPHIVYTDSKDTLFAMIDVARIGFIGKINTNQKTRRGKEPRFTPRNNTKGVTIDSLRVAGRIKRDTISVSLQKFYIQEDEGMMNIEGKARAMLATTFAGRIHLPIEISGKLDFPKDTVPAFAITDFKANVGDFPIVADADIRLLNDRAAVKAKLGIRNCKLNDVFHGFAKNVIPELDKIETDARLTMLAECDGEYIYETGKLPEFTATVSLPESRIRYADLGNADMRLSFAADGHSDNHGRMNASINNMTFTTAGLDINMKGGIKDALGADPSINIDGKLHASLDTLATILPDSLDINASGNIVGTIKGNALMSQLSIYNFSRADIVGNLSSDQILINMPSDSLDINIKGLDITAAPEERISRRDSTKTFRLGGVTAKVKFGKILYSDAFYAQTHDLLMSAKNSVNSEDGSAEESRINPLSGRVNASMLIFKDAASVGLNLSETKNTIMLRPKKDQPRVPIMSLTSKNDKITVSRGRNRAIISDASLKVRAEMNTVERRQRSKIYIDSLALVYPDVPRDSLLRHAASQRAARAVPVWLQEEDFKNQDIDIRLDETLAKYYRDWTVSGEIDVSKGYVITPYFPLNNNLRGFNLSFNNDQVKVDSFKVASGKSEIEAKGKLTGLRRAMTGRGNRSVMKLDMDINSEKINANELFAAYQKGLRYQPSETTDKEISDAELMRMIASSDTLSTDDSIISPLIVVPANLNADIDFSARNVTYADLLADTITAKVIMKERCMQIIDTRAHTNMGEISFDAFYSTKSKKDIKAGFDLNFKDITADKAVSLMPAIDTIMPLIKAFKGNLNCEVAATTQLDTNMNIVMPSINGIMRITGDDLSITENKVYRNLARKLLFKDKKEGHIEDMKLEALIHDNTLEIFPFVVSIDRYTLAMSGIQNLDMSYRYHASVIRSPLPVKIGVDIYGRDFDDMNYKIGKAKYKTENVPVFSSVIEQTRINLLDGIRNIFEKGVDAAVRENEKQNAVVEHKQKIGYVSAVDMKIEDLSEQEQEQIKAAEEEVSEGLIENK